MNAERMLKWLFEEPDDSITSEEFDVWEKKQSSSQLTEEKKKDLHDRILESVKNIKINTVVN